MKWYETVFKSADINSDNNLELKELNLFYKYIEGDLDPKVVQEIRRFLGIADRNTDLQMGIEKFCEVCSVMGIFRPDKILSNLLPCF